MKLIYAYVLKVFYNLILFAQKDLETSKRVEAFYESYKWVSPFAFVMGLINAWYMENTEFTLAVIVIIFINMVLGGIMHFMKGHFKWEALIVKTIKMVVVVGVTYAVLEMTIRFAGDGFLIQGFRAAIQVATLLYPAAKIMKQVFVLSNGEHPPQWIMQKLYNFQENGDLKEFLDTNKPKRDDT